MKNHLIFISFNSRRFAINNEKKYYWYGLNGNVCRTMLFSWNFHESVSEPIRVIPNKSEASFKPYQSEPHLKSIRTLNPNESDESKSVQTFNPNESEIDRIHSDWNFGFIRIVFELALSWFGLKICCGLIRNNSFSSESDSGMARNSADWFGMNLNPELSPGWTYMMFKIFF